jgi:hypothetical protein
LTSKEGEAVTVLSVVFGNGVGVASDGSNFNAADNVELDNARIAGEHNTGKVGDGASGSSVSGEIPLAWMLPLLVLVLMLSMHSTPFIIVFSVRSIKQGSCRRFSRRRCFLLMPFVLVLVLVLVVNMVLVLLVPLVLVVVAATALW